MPEITHGDELFSLVDLTLEAVALCSEGANSRAHILLKKGKETKSMPQTFDELIKALAPEQAEIINKHIVSITTSNAAEIAKLNDKITTLEKPAPSTEDILKSASPEMRAMIEQLQKSVKELTDFKAESAIAEKFQKCKALPVEEAQLKSVLKSASPAVIEILEKAAAAIEKGTHTPAGSDATPEFAKSSDAAYVELEKTARKIMETEPKTSFEQAFLKACEAAPETYKKHIEGGR